MPEEFDEEEISTRLQITDLFLSADSPKEIERKLEESDWSYVGDNPNDEVSYTYLLERDDDQYVVDRYHNSETNMPCIDILPYEEWTS